MVSMIDVALSFNKPEENFKEIVQNNVNYIKVRSISFFNRFDKEGYFIDEIYFGNRDVLVTYLIPVGELKSIQIKYEDLYDWLKNS